jgi:hypothetical protein
MGKIVNQIGFSIIIYHIDSIQKKYWFPIYGTGYVNLS